MMAGRDELEFSMKPKTLFSFVSCNFVEGPEFSASSRKGHQTLFGWRNQED